ncbi:MAG: hypothetical protein JSS53_03240 [Proteobacteria bacterium]|nr:hypothetical protein [Pseudomonadota bacterium]
MNINEDTSSLSQNERNSLSKSWARMVDCIVHDLGNRVVCMKLSNEILEKILLPKIDVLQEPPTRDETVSITLDKSDFKNIKFCIEALRENVGTFFAAAERLHPMNAKLFLAQNEFPLRTIQEYLHDALNQPELKSKIDISSIQMNFDSNFLLSADPFFMEPLFYHIISYENHRIKLSKQGTIRVWTEDSSLFDILHIADTSTSTLSNNVFPSFFFKQGESIMPDLGFCRLYLLQIGGDISCSLDTNNNLEFTIKFPKKIK